MSGEDKSQAFDLLHDKIKKWIWKQNWSELRDIQEVAIRAILSKENDIIIASSTASGKTEAAFLPICSRLASEQEDAIPTVIYVGPLRALINDQFSRMEVLCEEVNIPVHPWHGDISSSIKKKFLQTPSGILLITPESLEALFVNHGHSIGKLFKRLQYVVVDELHSFIGTERGKQLQSLLHRLESAIKRKVPRIGLSATLGDLALASDYLRPHYGDSVHQIVSSDSSQEVRLIIHSYLNTPPKLTVGDNEDTPIQDDSSFQSISSHLLSTLRGSNNLIFANSRNQVEQYADQLRRMCVEQYIPNEFWPHHGSLSKELRETAEDAIKKGTTPATIVCTTTLEMGIDIGAVKSIAQIGNAPSVSSIRQRLGRSGRRGEPAILRVYVEEDELTDKSPPPDVIRAGLVQSIAMVNLLIQKWCEPTGSIDLSLSTLIHQVLSVIAQHGGVSAQQAWDALCRQGPFSSVSQSLFTDLLRCMGKADLITQQSDGLLLPGLKGERIINHYSFYAVFFTPEEFRLISEGQTLGTLPVDRPLQEGSFLIFAGKRWKVIGVDMDKKIIELIPARGGKAPVFGGQVGWTHDRVRQEMLNVYMNDEAPLFIDNESRELLVEARENFMRLGLGRSRIIQDAGNAYMFCWKGDKVADTIAILLRTEGIAAVNEGIAIMVPKASARELKNAINAILQMSDVNAVQLASNIKNKIINKYDIFLSDHLLNIDFASSRLDVEGAFSTLQEIESSYN